MAGAQLSAFPILCQTINIVPLSAPLAARSHCKNECMRTKSSRYGTASVVCYLTLPLPNTLVSSFGIQSQVLGTLAKSLLEHSKKTCSLILCRILASLWHLIDQTSNVYMSCYSGLPHCHHNILLKAAFFFLTS